MLNFQNKKVMIAVVVAVLLVLGGVTYWYFNRSRGLVTPPSPVPVEQSVPESVAPEEGTPTSQTPVSQ